MKQITIITENRPGILAEISAVMAEAGVNIETLDAETVDQTGIAILTVDRYDAALQALARTSFRAFSEDALLVQLDDKPGELARITQRFKEAGINLRSVHIVRRSDGKAIVAMSTDRRKEAVELVRDMLVS